MALTEQQIDDLVETILHGTQEKYVQEMSDALVDHLVQGFTKLGDEAALQQLIETFPSQAQTILNKYRDVISQEVHDEVEKALSDSIFADLNQLESIYGQERADVAQAYFSLGATAHFANLAKTTAEQVADIVTRQNILMEQGAERMWYQVSQDAINEVVLGTKPYEKALSDGVVKLMDAGIGVIDYGSNGKATVSNMVDVALRRHIVSQVSQVGGRMSMEAMESYGHEFAITTAHFGARPSHAQWQGLPGCTTGEKTVDGYTYPDFYVLTGYEGLRGPNVALGDRLKGVNCKHGLHPFFPGITQLPDREFKAAQAKYHMTSDEYYEATQRQRELERRIRKTKREIVGLERAGIGLEDSTYVQKRLVLGKQQRILNKHCKDTGLVRLYNREKAYGVSSQPRALYSKVTAETRRRRTFFSKLEEASQNKTTSELYSANSLDELKTLLNNKHNVLIHNAENLDFESVKMACCGIDEVLSDFPKAKSWISISGEYLNKNTYMETSASGVVYVNALYFVGKHNEALSDGRHEAGHLIEVALANKGRGNSFEDFANAKQAKSILTAALKEMNASSSKKMKLDNAIDSVSFYPAKEAYATNNKSALYSEGLAMCIELAYNGQVKKSPFIRYVLEEIRRRLS